MTQRRETLIRAFDGSLSEATGLLAVERATFNESPYSAQQIQGLLTGGPQRAWVAIGEGEVVGFVVAFATDSLSGQHWEVDLLAVDPPWQGQGLATHLIRAAAAGSPQGARIARAVVATDNGASARAFTRAGFRPAPEICTLLIYRPADAALRPWRDAGVRVRETTNPAGAASWLDRFYRETMPSTRWAPHLAPATAARSRGLSLLLGEEEGRPAGYAELVEVQTLLYRGAWIESLTAPARLTREALVEQVLHRGIAAGWDEVGAMVPEQNWALANVLRAQGFHSLGNFRWLVADLPLPGATPPQHASGMGENQPGSSHG